MENFERDHKKLESLILFSEVAKDLSFTAAGDRLGVSKSYLSLQVRKLEQDLGIPLLVRSTRSVRLTPGGTRVLAGVEKIREALLHLERSVESEGKVIDGEINITAPELFTNHFLLKIFSGFREQHPDIRFNVDCSYTLHDLHRSNFDIAFRATSEPPENMVVKALYNYQHYFCGAPSYFEKYGRPLAPKDLIHHQCLSGQDQRLWRILDEEVQINGWTKINSHHMLKSLGLMGAGIFRAPQYLVEEDIQCGRLERLFIEQNNKNLTIYMVYPQLIYQPRRIAAFIEYTKEFFERVELLREN